MINFFSINLFFVLLINFIGIWLSFWVFFANRKAKLNQLFVLMTFSILLWITFGFLYNLPKQTFQALFLLRLTFGVISLFFIAAYFFSIYFPREEKKYLILNKVILGTGIVLCLTSIFTDLIIKNVEFKEWGTDFTYGKGGIIFLGIVIILTFLIIIQIFRKYFKLRYREKLKVQYFLVGTGIFALMNLIFNVFLPLWRRSIQYYQFGNYSAIFLLGFTAYAIVKRELFGIKVVLTALLVGLIAILLLLDALVFTENLIFQLLKGIILIIFLYFGYLLIKSVLDEIKRREEVEKISKVKSEFLSITSHQLRTPLSAIKGYLSMVLEETYGGIPERAKRPLENVYKANERLIKLVNDFLNISKIEIGKMEINFEKSSIEKIISEAVSEMEIKAKNKEIYLNFEKQVEPLPNILVDREKIKEVILNILDNAIKYTQRGGVMVRCGIENSKCKIVISDTGEGLTEEEISHLFESFSRGSAGARFWTEGAGLGLYIAKKFIEINNGKIWAESEGKGKGSTFFIELPIK